jgi:hypothetical protein
MTPRKTLASSPPPLPPPPPRPRCQSLVRRPRAVNVTQSRGNANGNETTGTTGLAGQSRSATTGTRTGTATAIAKWPSSPQDLTLSLFRPWTSRTGHMDLMNALMSILVNTLALEVVIDCVCFLFSLLFAPRTRHFTTLMPPSMDKPRTGHNQTLRAASCISRPLDNHGFPAFSPFPPSGLTIPSSWTFARSGLPHRNGHIAMQHFMESALPNDGNQRMGNERRMASRYVRRTGGA